MIQITNTDAYQVLCLQLADEGRGASLLGDCVERARTCALPFLACNQFPSVYFEFPLAGDPFLDVTLLYGKLEPGTRIDSPAASGCERLLDWYANAYDKHHNISFGFELDTSKQQLPAAAIHFQPRTHTSLVEPFFDAIGEPERAHLYLDLAERMPKGWELAFFGLFRGRPNSPLRVCGYLHVETVLPYTKDPSLLASVFDDIGFSAYDEAMLGQIATLLGTSSSGFDYQFDIYPDGSLGDTFAIDVQLQVEKPEAVRATMENGEGGRIMQLFEDWGIADDRWKSLADIAFARKLPQIKDDGTDTSFSFTLMPGWTKVRWRKCALQPAKYYYLGSAGLLEA